MKLGVQSKAHVDVRDVTDEWLARLRRWGFTHTGGFVSRDPSDLGADDLARIRDRLAGHDIALVQLWSGQPFVTPDEAGYEDRMQRLRADLRAAGALGCPVVVAAGGGFSPEGPWVPHVDNESERGVDQIIRRVRGFIAAAEDAGVHLALEPHTLSILRTPERVRRVIDEVGSRWLGCNLDPVNWMTFDNAFHMGDAIHRMFDVLGDRIVSGHAKDGHVEPRLVLHISETHAGNGLMDYAAYLTRFNQLEAWKPLVIEHTEDELVPAAKRHIDETAARLGIGVG